MEIGARRYKSCLSASAGGAIRERSGERRIVSSLTGITTTFIAPTRWNTYYKWSQQSEWTTRGSEAANVAQIVGGGYVGERDAIYCSIKSALPVSKSMEHKTTIKTGSHNTSIPMRFPCTDGDEC